MSLSFEITVSDDGGYGTVKLAGVTLHIVYRLWASTPELTEGYVARDFAEHLANVLSRDEDLR